MKTKENKKMATEIDNWLDELRPMKAQMAPAGFEQRVMAAINAQTVVPNRRAIEIIYSWQSLAAGIALLLALNLYTALSFKQSLVSAGENANNLSAYDNTADIDSYSNYTLLVMDDIK